MHIAGSPVRSFKCTCTREFIQESAYTKHLRSCTKGKKRLFSALSKAKDLLGSIKRPRLNSNDGIQDARVSIESSSTLLRNTPISTSTPNLGAAPAEMDDDSSLAQRRTRRVGVQMPLRYRQHEDVLPQPPPSIPSQATLLRECIPPSNPTDVHITTCTQPTPTPFRTARNVFGLVRQFFSSVPPSHD
ncbi:hypothetical protein P692DRAFT_20762509, partial [Suillus brevipes Sb2]